MKSGENIQPYIYFIRHDKLVLQAGTPEFPIEILTLVVDEIGMVIWEHQGSFRLIPYPILNNMCLICDARQKLKEQYPRTTVPNSSDKITWEQGITVSPAVVKALFLTPEKKLGDSDSATKTAGEDHPHQP